MSNKLFEAIPIVNPITLQVTFHEIPEYTEVNRHEGGMPLRIYCLEAPQPYNWGWELLYNNHHLVFESVFKHKEHDMYNKYKYFDVTDEKYVTLTRDDFNTATYFNADKFYHRKINYANFEV